VTIAVTGPLASGKSTFVELLDELGAETVSADDMVHHLLAEDDETITRVTERFGEEVRGEKGIARKALSQVVFGDAEALRDLEEILHPRVREETDRRALGSGSRLFVAEIPLLFEGGGEERFDLTVTGMEEQQRRAIEDRQFSQEEKARRADVVVENDGDLDRLREQARILVDWVLRERGSGEGGVEED
jgi:dephospho-CoA kinase